LVFEIWCLHYCFWCCDHLFWWWKNYMPKINWSFFFFFFSGEHSAGVWQVVSDVVGPLHGGGPFDRGLSVGRANQLAASPRCSQAATLIIPYRRRSSSSQVPHLGLVFQRVRSQMSTLPLNCCLGPFQFLFASQESRSLAKIQQDGGW
jgi:hypothetical protein